MRIISIRRRRFRTFSSGPLPGSLVGARLGYVFFYNFAHYVKHPSRLSSLSISPTDAVHRHQRHVLPRGGHRRILAAVIFCRKNKIDFWRLAELFCPAIPLGYTFGRIGNFINGELYGRVTTMPWGMYFPLDMTHQLRHPSQLYEALFEGVFLFIILWSVRKKSPSSKASSFPCMYSATGWFASSSSSSASRIRNWASSGES